MSVNVTFTLHIFLQISTLMKQQVRILTSNNFVFVLQVVKVFYRMKRSEKFGNVRNAGYDTSILVIDTKCFS